MRTKSVLLVALLAFSTSACDDDDESPTEHDDHDGHDHDHDHNHDNELITTVELSFTSSTGKVATATFVDEDGDGGASGTAERLVLDANTTYEVQLRLHNDLEDEDVTAEIAQEAEEHFVFFYGPSVRGPSSAGDGFLVHEFDDLESDYTENEVGENLPVGLSSIVTTSAAGDGQLSVLVRHLPQLNDAPQKSASLVDAFARGEVIAGNNDVNVVFEVVVE